MQRSTRSGSSKNVTCGSSGVRIIPSRRSARPCRGHKRDISIHTPVRKRGKGSASHHQTKNGGSVQFKKREQHTTAARTRCVRSSTRRSFTLKNSELMVRSRRHASSSAVPTRMTGIRLSSVYVSVRRLVKSMSNVTVPQSIFVVPVSKCFDCAAIVEVSETGARTNTRTWIFLDFVYSMCFVVLCVKILDHLHNNVNQQIGAVCLYGPFPRKSCRSCYQARHRYL